MSLKMLFNVAWFQSGSVYGAVYLVENADTGKRYLVQPHDHDADPATAIKFLPMSKSVLETMIAQNTAAFAGAIAYSSIEETVPDSQKDSNGYVLVDNVPTVAADLNTYRTTTANQIAFFSKKGLTVSDVPTNLQSVTSQNLQLWKSGLLSGTVVAQTTPTTPTTPTPTPTATSITGIAAIDSILLFFWNNPVLLAGGLFLLSEAFGLTNVLGFKKKRRR